MKKSLILLVIALSPFQLQAHDSAFQVAERFASNGLLPKKEDLMEKQVWFCRAHHAFANLENKVSELLPTFRFEKEFGFGIVNTLLLDHEVNLEEGNWVLRETRYPMHLGFNGFLGSSQSHAMDSASFNKKNGELLKVSRRIFQPSWGYNYLNTPRGVPFDVYEVIRVMPDGGLILEASIADSDIARFNEAFRDILDSQFGGYRWSGLPSKVYPQRQVWYYGSCSQSDVRQLPYSSKK